MQLHHCRLCSSEFDFVDESHGGAIFIQIYSNVSLTECQFTHNLASDDGGAIYLKIRSHLEVFHSEFQFNTAANSGGTMFVKHSKAQIQNSFFEREEAPTGFGGSICIFQVGNITIENTIFAKCYAAKGGSLAAMSESVLSIRNAAIQESAANVSGGAMCITHRSVLIANKVTTNNCQSALGGSISVNDSSILNIQNINFTLNEANKMGAAIHCMDSFVNMNISAISFNRALFNGGGIYADGCSAVFGNITFSGNVASQSGGVIYIDRCHSMMMHNCWAQNNSAYEASFLMLTGSSRLISTNLRLTEMFGGGSAITVTNSSSAELRHLVVDTSNHFCPIRVIRRSKLSIRSWYKDDELHDKDTRIQVPPRNTSSTKKDICVDGSSHFDGPAQSGKGNGQK